jgi:CRISPR-associated protein Cas2
MRLIVLFDLPTQTNEDKKSYIKFRKRLLDDGFMMLQYSVYTRICNGRDSVEKHIKRVKNYKPSSGNIRVLSVTEKQWRDMELIVGTKSHQEEKIQSEALTFF